MVVENIRGNCLILVAIPMTGELIIPSLLLYIFNGRPLDDIENQKAMTLAREQDPKGIRTIGMYSPHSHPPKC
jgi:hypothetical protein